MKTLASVLATALFCIGCADPGVDGTSTAEDALSAPAPVDPQYISAGMVHTCGIKEDQSIACWGRTVPYGQSTAPSGAFASVAAGTFHNCALRVDGTVACWGNNERGQARPPSGVFISVSAAASHSCAMKADRSVVCWGEINVVPSGTFSSYSAGAEADCALRSDGTIGGSYECVAGAPEGPFVAVSTGFGHVCATKADRTAVCWWLSYAAEYYRQTENPQKTELLAVSSGKDHSCGIKSDRSVVCWGADNWTGHWGEFETFQDWSQTNAPAGSFAAVTANGNHSCAIRTDGSATCWGNNSDGQASPPAVRFKH